MTEIQTRISHRFTIGLTDGGRWLAVSTRAPYFSFDGDSRDEVRQIAHRALNWYFDSLGRVVSRPEPRAKNRNVSIASFRPIEHVE